MRFLGYGEDALTLIVLKKYFNDILLELKPTAKAKDCIILYRPSLGRKFGFGEFDFIIVSSDTVFLGETKSYSNRKNINVVLPDKQALRYVIFAKYIKSWFSMIGPRDLNILRDLYPELEVPRKQTTLYDNIDCLLKLISTKCVSKPKIINSILLVTKGENKPNVNNKSKMYRVVHLHNINELDIEYSCFLNLDKLEIS